MKHIYDPNFRYTSSAATDIRKTFRRIRRELEEKKRHVPGELQPPTRPVIQLRRIA